MKRKIFNILAVLVILSVLVIPLVPLAVGATSGSIDVTVTGSTNDGYILDSSGYDNSGTLLYTGNSFDTFSTWEKFDGITIPAGATITAAYMSCYVSSVTGSPTTKIYADDGSGASPVAPTTYGDYLGKTTTTASVAWNAMAGSGYINSPSLVSVIQELVNSYTYSSGSIQILFKDNSSGSSNIFTFYSVDFGNAPKLHIEYTYAGTPHTYYVATTGSDSADGSIGTPWLTIQKALNTAVASDTVNIEAGTYTCTDLTCANSGTLADGYITYQNYNGGTVNITDGGSGAYKSGIDTNSKNYLKFIGLNLTGNANTFMNFYVDSSSYIVIQNCSITTSQDSGIQADNSSYITIDGCTITGTNSVTEECISMVTCDHFEVKNCIVHDPASLQRIGIDCKVGCTNGSVHNNTLYSLSGTYEGGIYVDARGTSYSIDIYDNLIHNVTGNGACAISVADEAPVGADTVHDINIYNNIIYNIESIAFEITLNSTESYSNIYFINNTCYNCGTTASMGFAYLASLTSAHATNIVIRNNIVYNAVANTYTVYDPNGLYGAGKLLIDYNLYYNPAGWDAGESTNGANAVLTNPLLTNPTTDFSIQNGSPAIGSGFATLAPSVDYVGTARPQGVNYDIGAYEYIGGGTTTTTTTVPTTTGATVTPVSTSIAQDLPVVFGAILIITMIITAVTTRSVSAVITATIIGLLGIFGIVLLENLILSIFGNP